MKREGFGAVDLLIGLLAMAAIFLISANAFKGVSTLKLNDSPLNSKSVQEQVNDTVNEIENMRQQTLEYEKQMKDL